MEMRRGHSRWRNELIAVNAIVTLTNVIITINRVNVANGNCFAGGLGVTGGHDYIDGMHRQ